VDAEGSLRGALLVASPALHDPNFRRTVVLVAEHGENGAMGIVLNRPSDARAVDAIPAMAGLVEAGGQVFAGGPVESQAVMILAEFDDLEDAAAIVFADVGFVRADVAGAGGLTRRVRLFAGYAGWGAGQLEAELAEEAWVTAEPLVEDVFTAAPEELWSTVLRRLGGRFALVATMPPDPSLN
jgi:putative transcriptional regulator